MASSAPVRGLFEALGELRAWHAEPVCNLEQVARRCVGIGGDPLEVVFLVK